MPKRKAKTTVQTCKFCGDALLLTKIKVDIGKFLYAYLCTCNDLVYSTLNEQDKKETLVFPDVRGNASDINPVNRGASKEL
jgi:hypothetical protein